MKTKRYTNDKDNFRCFGFPNTFIGKEGVREILLRLPTVEIKYLDKHWGVDIFCEFIYKDEDFFVSEPYGDNSYYEITCDNANTPELEEIYKLFSLAKAPTNRQRKRIALYLSLAIIFFVGLYAIK